MPLRPYQEEAGRAILDSVVRHRGLTFTVEMARQAGKNELSAQLEALLLGGAVHTGASLVKAAPTFVPQCLISIRRLVERLNDVGLHKLWWHDGHHAIRIKKARQLFLSAVPPSNVVGVTADPLLEIDEAQDVDRDKFWKEFRPMGASTNATTVLYGTAWDGASLLEEVKQANIEAQRRDGIRRHFSYDWEAVAEHNPLYRKYVEAERARLGEEHPLFRTQYMLLPLSARGGLFSPQQLAAMQGSHPRQHAPSPGKVYVAGLDVAGGYTEAAPDTPHDATILTIGEMDFACPGALFMHPAVRVVEHYRWHGIPHDQLLPQLLDILRMRWACRRVVVDATGLGHTVAAFLETALGQATATPFVFSSHSKSRLGYELMAAANTGRIKMYARDGSQEWQEFWNELHAARARYRPDRMLSFHVDEPQGHDDYLMSLALLMEASHYQPRVAKGRGSSFPVGKDTRPMALAR